MLKCFLREWFCGSDVNIIGDQRGQLVMIDIEHLLCGRDCALHTFCHVILIIILYFTG